MNNYENKWESVFNAVMNMKTPETDTQLKSAEIVFRELDRIYSVLSGKFESKVSGLKGAISYAELSLGKGACPDLGVRKLLTEYEENLQTLESDFEKAYQHYYTILAGGETND